jgi:hypothetical protein
MSEFRTLPVVGEELTDIEWEDVESDIKAIKSCGMNVIKILNYKGGSTKFIANVSNGFNQYDVRKKLEDVGWSMGPPYFSKGSVVGFKLSKVQSSSDSSAWGGS